jgi:hypothetical protein
MRFVNHCCTPNCVMEKWLVNGHTRVAVYALQNLRAGDELTYDYEFVSHSASQSCYCGAELCRRHIRGKTDSCGNVNATRTPLPLSMRQLKLVRTRHVFLLRNRQRHARSHNAIRSQRRFVTNKSSTQSKSTSKVKQSDVPKISPVKSLPPLTKTSPSHAKTSHGDILITNTVDMSYMDDTGEIAVEHFVPVVRLSVVGC